jgi:hypothetical protein
MAKIKRLFFDIETSPNIGFFWTAGYKQNIFETKRRSRDRMIIIRAFSLVKPMG